MIPLEWIEEADQRIRRIAVQTPLTYDEKFNVYLKWESKQITGSFKLRGALNKILTMPEWERAQGLVTVSAGNHGQGFAMAARETGAKAIVFASSHALPVKIQAMQNLGADVHLVDGGYAEAESTAKQFAHEYHHTWISPYNDGQVIAGQGTVGLEITEQVKPSQIRTIFVPVGGGGLISGIGASISGVEPRPKLVGVQSEASSFMYALYHYRSQDEVIEKDSIADGLSGRNEDESITIPLVRKFVDDFLLFPEQAIEQAMVFAWEKYGEIIEGSAAVALAAALTAGDKNLPAVVVISGGNVQPEVHQALCKKWKGISIRGIQV